MIRGVEVALADSYIAGCILLGIAPCTAMVLMWGYLSFSNPGPYPGNGGHQLPGHAVSLRAPGTLAAGGE